MDQRLQLFRTHVEKTLEHLHVEFATLQTGRASASLVENVQIEAYGQRQPLKALAGIGIQDARTIVVQPWDRSIVKHIEAALSSQDLGASPVSDGTTIRIVLPLMTEERRMKLRKVVSELAEEARIAIRKHRQDIHDAVKRDEKDEDVRYTLLEELDTSVKQANERVEADKKRKEEELMKV